MARLSVAPSRPRSLGANRARKMTLHDASFWDRMLERRVSRRALIRGTAVAALGVACPSGLALGRPGRLRPRGRLRLDLERFTPIAPGSEDELRLPREFAYDTLLRWQDPIHERGDRFGFNCDFTCFLPLGPAGARPAAGLRPPPEDHRWLGRGARVEGLLVVSHEYPSPVFLPDLEEQRRAVGLSVVHLRREATGPWRAILDSRYARRYDGRSECRLTGPAAGLAEGGRVTGTMGNCSGGLTPWGTVLSCEENTLEYGLPAGAGGYGWGDPWTRALGYSWVVEIDPFDPEWVPRKRTALGRFRHENVALRLAPDGRLAAYMGDDRPNGFVYKYVSRGRYDPARGLANAALLEDGVLHVAHCREDGTGAWTPLPATEECLADTHAWVRARGLAATPMDRPEDVEVHPADGSAYLALTHNFDPAPGRVLPPVGADPYGKVARFVEEGGDPLARGFRWEVFAVGGPAAGFAAPDNLEFDGRGNLWVISDFAAGGPPYAGLGNNGMYMVRTSGEDAGIAFQFASGPVDCELTGPWLAPDETALFLAVQHPGARSPSMDQLTSHWPDGSGVPRPSVVTIRRLEP